MSNLKLASTGNIVAMYLEANRLSAMDLANEANVSLRTIIRILNDERSLSPNIAIAMAKLIPGVTAEFLMVYDTKYQMQKSEIESQNCDMSISKINSLYHMKKLYPDLAKDEISLFEKAKEIFGLDNLKKGVVDISNLQTCFSLAKNPDDNRKSVWVKSAYYDCLKEANELLTFDMKKFIEEFARLKSKTFTTDKKTTIYNMKSFCKKVGINFYFRESIPNSRIKAVAIKDEDGYVFIFVSNLFKCIENLWLAFIHECLHIKNDDFSKNLRDESEVLVNENYIDRESMLFFIGDETDLIGLTTIDRAIFLSNKNQSPIGIICEIARFLSVGYQNSEFNSYIHYFK